MEAEMAKTELLDPIEALVQTHENLISRAANADERLLNLERRLADTDPAFVKTEGKSGALRRVVNELQQSEAVAAVLKGAQTKAGIDLPASALNLGVKSAIVSDATGGGYLAPNQYAGVESSAPQLVQRLRDLIPVSRATSGSIEWLQQTNAKQLAEPQYSADSPAQRDGALKSASTFTMVPRTSPVITLAHYVEASRQILSDNALLLDFLRGELFDGVERRLEEQIIDGTGTSGELDGLGNASNYTALTGAVTGDSSVDLIRRAIGQLQASGYSPDAIVLNAADWASIELTKSLELTYVSGNPRQAMEATLWGVRVFPSQYISEGTFIVGAFAQSMRLWVRQEAMLLVSDSHDTNFVRNLIAMIAEARMASTVTRPAGIIRASF